MRRYMYPEMVKNLGEFHLQVNGGQFTDSEIIVMLGENGTGKTTFIRLMAGLLKPDSEGNQCVYVCVCVCDCCDYLVVIVEIPRMNVSYKPQKISPKFPGSVRQLLHNKIQDSYIHPQFIADVVKPLQLENLYDQEVTNLSGGELQRVALTLCLGQVFYIITLIFHLLNSVYY